MLVRIMALVNIFSLELCFASENHTAEVLPYKATYLAKYNDFPITAVKILQKDTQNLAIDSFGLVLLMARLFPSTSSSSQKVMK